MSYKDVIDMANNNSLRERVMGCAATEGHNDPRGFTERNIMRIVATPTWADDWAYATDTYNGDQNPDTGARGDVISDAKILSAVQPLVTDEMQPAPPPEE